MACSKQGPKKRVSIRKLAKKQQKTTWAIRNRVKIAKKHKLARALEKKVARALEACKKSPRCCRRLKCHTSHGGVLVGATEVHAKMSKNKSTTCPNRKTVERIMRKLKLNNTYKRIKSTSIDKDTEPDLSPTCWERYRGLFGG